jgi:hypothetical protein
MTVTKDQAQMLATLACASRPTGARQWNPAKVMVEIGTLRARGLSLGAIACAVFRCAMDRNVEREGCISSPGSHWSDTRIAEVFVPQVMDSRERCSICSMAEPSCRMRHSVDDHEFESVAMAAKRKSEADPQAIQGAIAALKAGIEPAEKTPTKTLEATDKPELKARLDALLEKNPGLRSEPMKEQTNGEIA